MMFFEYIGGSLLFSEVEYRLNTIAQEPLALILGGLIVGAMAVAFLRYY
jgi:expansin (peptidoglycan-binding protein)